MTSSLFSIKEKKDCIQIGHRVEPLCLAYVPSLLFYQFFRNCNFFRFSRFLLRRNVTNALNYFPISFKLVFEHGLIKNFQDLGKNKNFENSPIS